MKKRFILWIFLLIFSITLIGCKNEKIDTAGEDSEFAVNVNGIVYYDTGIEVEKVDENFFVGIITSTCENNEIPTENGQSNFGTGMKYQFIKEGELKVQYASGTCILFKTEKQENNSNIDRLIGEAIINDGKGNYLKGEYVGEGHIILGTENVSSNEIKVYALTMYGEYGFENSEFNKISGTGCIPKVFTLQKEDNYYKVIKIERPEDGSDYTKSIKKLFPLKYQSRVLKISEEDYTELSNMEKKYINKYLKEINRDAKIVKHSEKELLTDKGVSVEVSNKLLEYGKDILANYPYWIGTREEIIDGARYIYEMEYNEKENRIEYTKTKAKTDTIEEWIYIDSTTAEIIDQSK